MKSEKVKLESVCKRVVSGGTPKSTVSDYYNGSIPWLNTKEVHFNRIYSTEKTISDDGLKNSSAKWIPSHCVIIAMYGATAGNVAINMLPLTTNQACCNLELDEEKADFRYIYYYLKYKYMDMSLLANGGAQQNLNAKIIKDFPISLPELKVQRKIASMLWSLDDKIALNNKINENLEQQARTVFEDWFVFFEPFENEEFSRSPIGTEIPKSLQMRQIADIPHVLETGKRPRGGAASSGIPSVGAENVKKLGDFDFSSNKFIPVEFAEKQKTGKITGYELLLYKDGGKPGTFTPHFSMFGEGFPYKEFFINEHVFKLDFFDHGKNEFAYFYMQTDYATSWFSNNGGKAAIPGINRQDVRSLWIYDMEHPKIKQFCDWVQPVFKMIFSNCYENMKLVSLRDTLLPKLMNSEFDIEDVI